MSGMMFFTEEEMGCWEQIRKAHSVVITSHIHPDGDAVGSCLAMKLFCESRGVKASVVIDDNIPDIYRFLEGYGEILKPSEQVQGELLLILDTNPGRIGRMADGKFQVSVNIDHHITNSRKCDYHIVREMSSNAELLYRLLKSEEFNIDSKMAECLYTGLITDTVFFKSPGATQSAFLCASDLVNLGVEPSRVNDYLSEKTMDEIILQNRAVDTLESYFGGRVAGVCLDVSFSELELTDDIIDTIRYIKGISIAFLIKYDHDNVYRVRMRSQKIDLRQIAKKNGGGGHPDAAGFNIVAGSILEARDYLIKELGKCLE